MLKKIYYIPQLTQIFIQLWIMQFWLKSAGYPKVIQKLREKGQGTASFKSYREQVLRLQKRKLCPTSCLTQALVIFWACKSEEDLTLKLGVSKACSKSPSDGHQKNMDDSKAILAHAWIEKNGLVVWGKLEQRFQVIYTEETL